MKIVIYRKIDRRLTEAWLDLWKKSDHANYVNSPQWFIAALKSFGYKDFVVISVYEKENLVGVVPLVRQKRHGVSVFTAPAAEFACGVQFLYDFNDKSVMKKILNALLDLGEIYLEEIPNSFLESLADFKSDLSYLETSLNYFLVLKGGGEGEVELKNRKKLMWRARGCEDKFELLSFDGNSPEVLKTIFDIDIKSSKHTRGYETFMDRKTKEFYKSLAEHFRENIVFNVLYFEKTAIAYEIGFVAGKSYFGSQTAYLACYGRFAPGKVLAVKLMQSLYEKGITIFDFGSGDSDVKKALTRDYTTLYKIILSRKKAVRDYLKAISWARNFLYRVLSKRSKVYSFYRQMRLSLSA